VTVSVCFAYFTKKSAILLLRSFPLSLHSLRPEGPQHVALKGGDPVRKRQLSQSQVDGHKPLLQVQPRASFHRSSLARRNQQCYNAAMLTKSHVLLINPWLYDFAAYNEWVEPLGLLSVAAVLRENGYTLSPIDCLDRNSTFVSQVCPRHPSVAKYSSQGRFIRHLF
jgi:hypothetical protein